MTIEQFVRLVENEVLPGGWHISVGIICKDANGNMLAHGSLHIPREGLTSIWWPDGPLTVGVYDAESDSWHATQQEPYPLWFDDFTEPLCWYDITNYRVQAKYKKYAWEDL